MSQIVEFNQLKADLIKFLAPVKTIAVTDKASSEVASVTLREVKHWERKVEEMRKKLVGPLNDEVDRINHYAKMLKSPISDAEKHLKDRLLEFEKVLQAEREAELKKEYEENARRKAEAQKLIEAEAEKAQTLAMFAEPEKAAEIESKAQGEAIRINFEATKEGWDAKKQIVANKVPGVRRSWKFEVQDHGKVPSQYLSVDEKKIRAAVADGVREIPGVRIFQETSITAR